MSKCRICLCSDPRKNITELKLYENGKERNYKDLIKFCLGIQITEDFIKSTKLCVKCYSNIIHFYEFKLLALENDELLRSEFENGVNKEEKDIEINKKFENGVYCDKEEDIEINKGFENGLFCVKEEEDIEINEENCKENIEKPIGMQIKTENDSIVDAQSDEDQITDFKDEYNEENYSDDDFLIVIRNIKGESVVETEENSPVQKKKREKVKKILTQEELKAKEKRNKGIYEGVCEHCGKVYKDITAHVRLKHSIRKDSVPCEYCNKFFKNELYKQSHIQRKHSKQSCPLCKRFVGNLKMHMQTIHEKDSLPFKCIHCDKKYLTQAQLKMHTTIHTKERPYPCEICGSAFKRKEGRAKHIRQVHNKEKGFLCQFCSKSFFSNYYLKNHLRSHTKENPYKCPDCEKCYRSTKSLSNHRLVHGAEKKFICAICDAAFLSKNYLGTHMISHVKEKRYPCHYCTVRFHRSDHRKRHEYTAHLKHTGSVLEVPRSYTPKKRSAITSRTKRV